MSKKLSQCIILLLLAIVLPRNVVQDWLTDNKSFIQSPNKSINFTYSFSHPDYKSESKNLTGQLITSSENKFKLIMGPRTIYSNGEKWVSHDSRTNQAIIQNPDSSLYNSIVAMTHYKELNKLLSVSVLKNNTATIYNRGQKIEIKFKNKKMVSILSVYNSINVEISMIEFDNQLVISDSLFVFNENTAMMIDLRE
jgi:outer membrane lipoprotein-sorting protein